VAAGIRLEGVSKQFTHRTRGDRWAVRDVTLDVPPGRFLTLLGPSGCGKTTTLRMIAGFEQPTRGRVLLGDRDVTGLMANRRNIGFVFQNYALFPHLPVGENVAYGLRVRRRPEPEIRRAVAEVLELVGLAGYARQFPHQLSGGEQQRVALARAVVIRPEVLLFDEPLSNLDAKLRVHMRSEIRQLQERLSITAVYVTHDQEEAMAIADEIAVMDGGRVVQLGSAEDLYARPATTFVAKFIGRTNVVRALIAGREDGGLLVEVNGRRLRAECEGDPPAAGTVALAIRPETIELGPAASDHDSAVIASRVFLGEKVDYMVRWGGESLLVTAYDPIRRGTFSPGDRVDVRLPTTGLRVLADQTP
jgi:iron(III) transport system ATP-binding protein